MKIFKCKHCKKGKDGRVRKGQIYCSKKCLFSSGTTGFKKGHKIVISNEARKRQGKKISEMYIGEGNPAWKGNSISHHALHTWIRRHYGRPSDYQCKHCNKQAYDWANVDHKYRRDIKDFMPLCRKCHTAYDYKNKLRV